MDGVVVLRVITHRAGETVVNRSHRHRISDVIVTVPAGDHVQAHAR